MNDEKYYYILNENIRYLFHVSDQLKNSIVLSILTSEKRRIDINDFLEILRQKDSIRYPDILMKYLNEIVMYDHNPRILINLFNDYLNYKSFDSKKTNLLNSFTIYFEHYENLISRQKKNICLNLIKS